MDSLTMDNVEQLTLAELRELQTKRLKQTLTFVYENSPVYKKKFDEAGVHPDDFVTLDDLAKFPFTTKQDLRDNYPFWDVCRTARANCAFTCIIRHNWQTDGGGLYPKRY